MRLKTLADIQVAQFFIPKNESNSKKIITDEEYLDYLSGRKVVHGMKAGMAGGVSAEKRFFHWFLEFPVVFAGGGFDCILGNPPFLGNRKLKNNFGPIFLEWVKYEYAPAGICDLVTYFFRRVFKLLNKNGFQSLISTNTIAQGNAREGGLDIILEKGGKINFAVRSMKWPGVAVLNISLISINKSKKQIPCMLNDKAVGSISSLLNDIVENQESFNIKANMNKCFQGVTILGKGFLLSHEKANKLISANKNNSKVISPYLSGSDLYSNFDQMPSRAIINFSKKDIAEAQKYAECFSLIKDKVYPERMNKVKGDISHKWWQFWRTRPELQAAIVKKEKVFIKARISKTFAIHSTSCNKVFPDGLVIFAFSRMSVFSILQSCLHEQWSWKYCTTMKTDMNYGPTRIFQTFPFPQYLTDKMENDLERCGKKYHDFRQKIMIQTQLGFTKIYNQFHNSDLKTLSSEEIPTIPTLKVKDIKKRYGNETANLCKHLDKTEGVCNLEDAVQDILRLRNLHKKMDETVLRAYGWEDLELVHDFYEVDYLPENDRVRFTISNEARKEVLRRLLKLNHEIYDREKKSGNSSKIKTNKKKSKKKKNANVPEQRSLF